MRSANSSSCSMRMKKHKLSRESERRASRETRARLQPQSGALPFAKGDLKDDINIIEDKITEKASYSLKKATLQKLNKEALQHRRAGVMRITIQDETVYVLSKYAFIEYKNGSLK